MMPWAAAATPTTPNSTGNLVPHNLCRVEVTHPSPPRPPGSPHPTPFQGPEQVAPSGHFPGISAFAFPGVIGERVGGGVGGDVILI